MYTIAEAAVILQRKVNHAFNEVRDIAIEDYFMDFDVNFNDTNTISGVDSSITSHYSIRLHNGQEFTIENGVNVRHYLDRLVSKVEIARGSALDDPEDSRMYFISGYNTVSYGDSGYLVSIDLGRINHDYFFDECGKIPVARLKCEDDVE